MNGEIIMNKKNEHFNHQVKRMCGYLTYRKQMTYRYNLKDLMSYKATQERIMKREGCWGWWKSSNV